MLGERISRVTDALPGSRTPFTPISPLPGTRTHPSGSNLDSSSLNNSFRCIVSN